MSAINEDDLHAYVDATLDAARRLEVEAWLASHPEDATRVQDWARQNQALHSAFDQILNEPLPLALVRASRHRPRLLPTWRSAAASLVLASVAGLLGYDVGLRNAPTEVRTLLPHDAALAHVVFTPEQKHPVEVEASHAEHLTAWLSKRLGTRLAAPDFTPQGFALMGGRLLAGGDGPVAQFMYQDAASRRLTLYVRRDAQDNTAFRHAQEKGVEVFYWIDRDLGYALSGEIARADMQRLAEAAYHQLGH